MEAKDFTKGLQALAKQHENDKYGLFDTNWVTICLKTADFIASLEKEIRNLEREIEDRDRKIAEYKKWYNENERAINQALSKKEVDIPDFVLKEPEESDSVFNTNGWDGVRRDYEDGFTPITPGEDPFDNSIRPLFPLKD